MKRKMVIGAAAAALVGAAVAAAPAVRAQGGGTAPPQAAEMMVLQGAESEVGMTVRDLRAEEVAAAKLPQPGGALVQEVREGGAAARAGLRSGDIVVEFDGERVRSARHLLRLVHETPAGRTVTGVVLRAGARQQVAITPEAGDRLSMTLPDLGPALERRLRAIPRRFPFALPPDAPLPPGAGAPRGRLGLTLAPLTPQLAAYFGVTGGVLVSSVNPDLPASQFVKAGDVITQVNGRAVREVRDVTTIVRDAPRGATLELHVFRDRKELIVKVPLADATTPRVLPV
jgi:serine protease Do